jgi:proteasome accessory factor C
VRALREAAHDHERLEIEYFAHSSGEWSTRRIDPEEVFSSLGKLVRGGVGRRRRRRASVPSRPDPARRQGGERFEPRGLAGAGRALYTPTAGDVPVRLALSPGARWIAEYYATADEREGPNGTFEVTLPTARLGWVAGLLLRVGSDAQVLDPPELADRVRELAARTERGYRQG